MRRFLTAIAISILFVLGSSLCLNPSSSQNACSSCHSQSIPSPMTWQTLTSFNVPSTVLFASQDVGIHLNVRVNVPVATTSAVSTTTAPPSPPPTVEPTTPVTSPTPTAVVTTTTVPPASLVDTVTPTERAEWEKVAVCEEQGNWSFIGPVYSGIGFLNSTWRAKAPAVLGSAATAYAGYASEDDQIMVAESIEGSYVPDQDGVCVAW